MQAALFSAAPSGASTRLPTGASLSVPPAGGHNQITLSPRSLIKTRWPTPAGGGATCRQRSGEETAAHGGLAYAKVASGSSLRLEDNHPGANRWKGILPAPNTDEDVFHGLAPIGYFCANAQGLYDMTGNVWELTRDSWSLRPEADKSTAAAAKRSAAAGADTIRGGSWLCADNFCCNNRPAARQVADPSMGTKHIGFQIVKRAPNTSHQDPGDP